MRLGNSAIGGLRGGVELFGITSGLEFDRHQQHIVACGERIATIGNHGADVAIVVVATLNALGRSWNFGQFAADREVVLVDRA